MKQVIIITLLLLSLNGHAQSNIATDTTTQVIPNTEVQMADTFRKEGKIYVVVGVIAIVMAGMFVYLILIDNKIGKLEKEFHNDQQAKI